MPTFEIDLENYPPDVDGTIRFNFSAYCETCGSGICNSVITGFTRFSQTPYITVQPCEECLRRAASDAAKDAGEEAYERGYSAARWQYDVGEK